MIHDKYNNFIMGYDIYGTLCGPNVRALPSFRNGLKTNDSGFSQQPRSILCSIVYEILPSQLLMSSIEYRGLRGKIAKEIDWPNEGGTWLSLCEGLIAEGSENSIVSAASLLKELERQDNLGIDNLDGLKELLKEMNKWAVIDEVNTFEMKRQRYVSLRDKIVLKLEELNDLNRLIALSKPPLTEAIVNTIDSVRALFKELESRNRLGPSCFRIVRKILSDTREEDLLKEVEDFEKERKEEDLEHRKRVEAEARSQARYAAVYSVPRALGRMIRGVNLHSVFRTTGDVLVTVGVSTVLYSHARGRDDVEQFARIFNKVVLPAGNFLRGVCNRSLCFMIQAETKTDLVALWQMYLEGRLRQNLQEFLVTDKIKELANGEEVKVTVHIDEQEYQDACLDLMIENQVFAKSGDDVMLRTRRNSDSVVYIKPKENEVTVILSELKKAQIEFQKEKIESLEKQNASLREWLEDLELMMDGSSDWECHSNVSLESGFWSQSNVSEPEVENLEGSHVEIPGSQPVFPTPLSRQTTNFALLCQLLLDVGTQVLRDTFDRIIPPEKFQRLLREHSATLRNLLRRRVITSSQLERLFPTSGTSVSSAQLDASTLFLLFRTICGMSCPATGWFQLPLATDISPEADLVRVKHYSNHVISRAEHASVDDAKFQQLWSEIRKPLIRLGGPRYEDIIDALKIHEMDFDEREYNKEFSLQFEGEIDAVQKKMGKISIEDPNHFNK